MKFNKLEKDLKQEVLASNFTFKTAFFATLGFYAANFLISVVALILIGGIIAIAALFA